MLDWGCNHSSGIVWIGEREREREEEEREKEEKESAWREADCMSTVTSSSVGDSHDSLSEGGLAWLGPQAAGRRLGVGRGWGVAWLRPQAAGRDKCGCLSREGRGGSFIMVRRRRGGSWG